MRGETALAGTLIVIGGGQAAVSLIAKLRDLGDTRPITLVSEETVPPYQRPPLSKKYLLGEIDLARLLIRPERWYEDHDVTLRLGVRVERIDRAAGCVNLSNGESLTYESLALTTGSTPRRLPLAIGGDLAGVFTVRSLEDVDAMVRDFAPGRSVLVVGGGYIGLEAAAVAAKLGLRVTVLEMADRILQRVAAPATSDFFRALHQDNGVEIRESTALETLIGEQGRVTGARLATGEVIEVDFVVVGIGILPNDGLAEASGLAVDDGILVDAACRTSDPAIVAAGDCARFPLNGGLGRLESVQNAVDQGEAAAESLTGAAIDYRPAPWFWSDQFDVKLQIAGLNTGFETTVTRPGKREGGLSVWYYRGAELLAVDAMNDGATYMIASRLLKAGASPTPEQVADPGLDLKTLLAR
ncbi:MAG: FAD-dependent oxidoreductase [Alphaproteobacteria bacterium]|jgi:3-phenylpropionate/trans-cinnamate dioxygenase ferredoxin reductase subunit|nr:FAD-dependent oxidoreductase [Alphaproteobacteria bacterium]